MSSLTLDPKSPFYSPEYPPLEWRVLPEIQLPASIVEYVSIQSILNGDFFPTAKLPETKPLTKRTLEKNSANGSKKFYCPIKPCKNKYACKGDLKKHVIAKHNLSQSDLNRHFPNSKFNNYEKPFPCPLENCSTGYAHKSDLKAHIVKDHFINPTEANRLLPQARNSNKTEKPFACPVDGCSSGYSRERDLKRHMNVKHLIKF